jgi:hypothetical protein
MHLCFIYIPVRNVFDAGKSITWTSGRGLGPGNFYFFGPQTLQRQNDENLKQIFPEKEYRGLSPNFHIHVSVSELYIPTMGRPFLLEEICGPILGIYKSLTDT